MSYLEHTPIIKSPDQLFHIPRELKIMTDAAIEYTDSYGIDAQDGFEGLEPDELFELGQKILMCNTVFDGYVFMADTPKSGDPCYYDRIVAPQHRRAYKSLAGSLNHIERNKVPVGIDIAGGTGITSAILADHCRFVAVVDLVPELLAVAEKRLSTKATKWPFGKNFDFCTNVMDATELDFEPDTFDIAVSNALGAYLDYDEARDYYKKIRDILKPGGKYYEYQNFDPNPVSPVYHTSPRGELVEKVASILFGFTLAERTRKMGSQIVSGQELGLTVGYMQISDGARISQTERVAVFIKE